MSSFYLHVTALFVSCNSREAPSIASLCSSRLGSADVEPKARRRVRISVRFLFIYLFIYLDGCTEQGSDWLVGWLVTR